MVDLNPQPVSVPARPTCDCSGRAPTWPVFRDTYHLPDCAWFYLEQIGAAFDAYRMATDARLRRLEKAETRLLTKDS